MKMCLLSSGSNLFVFASFAKHGRNTLKILGEQKLTSHLGDATHQSPGRTKVTPPRRCCGAFSSNSLLPWPLPTTSYKGHFRQNCQLKELQISPRVVGCLISLHKKIMQERPRMALLRGTQHVSVMNTGQSRLKPLRSLNIKNCK
jgi:hypothetical protein